MTDKRNSQFESLKGTPKQRWKLQHRKQRMKDKGIKENFTATLINWEGVNIIEVADDR